MKNILKLQDKIQCQTETRKKIPFDFFWIKKLEYAVQKLKLHNFLLVLRYMVINLICLLQNRFIMLKLKVKCATEHLLFI